MLGIVEELLSTPEGRWVAGFVIAGVVSTVAFAVRALTVSGAAAATVVGGTIVGAAGWWPGLVLVIFFTTSSALSKGSDHRLTSNAQVRGKRRDVVQVLANGGIPALCAAASLPGTDDGRWLVALVAAIAGAAADTWATEIGRLSRSRPRMITTWRLAASGTSGAVSVPGTLGSLCGALAIALTAAVGAGFDAFAPGMSIPALIGIVTSAGVGGSLMDSILGATVQATYRCPACQVATEASIHRCGTATTLTGGLRWVTNDTVNMLAIAFSAAMALIWSTVG